MLPNKRSFDTVQNLYHLCGIQVKLRFLVGPPHRREEFFYGRRGIPAFLGGKTVVRIVRRPPLFLLRSKPKGDFFDTPCFRRSPASRPASPRRCSYTNPRRHFLQCVSSEERIASAKNKAMLLPFDRLARPFRFPGRNSRCF